MCPISGFLKNKDTHLSLHQVRPEEKRDLRLEDDDDDAPEFVRSATRRRHRRSLAARGGERVDMFSDCSGRKPMTFLGVILYYHTAPVTKFCFHTVSSIWEWCIVSGKNILEYDDFMNCLAGALYGMCLMSPVDFKKWICPLSCL